jgi:lysophospholipase L1-like esterase
MKRFSLLFVLWLVTLSVYSQESRPFENEVKNLIAKDSLITNRKNIILFTGSSSIAYWKDVQTYFPDKNILNRGFGGSTMRDLVYYTPQVIIPYNPKTIFIYEGDNDINSGHTSKDILASADTVLNAIRKHLPATVKVYFIAAKPSVARWHLKDHYIAFNNALKAWTKTKPNVYFIDVWTPMMDSDGMVRNDLFIEDNLHMNKTGYAIWFETIKPYVN